MPIVVSSLQNLDKKNKIKREHSHFFIQVDRLFFLPFFNYDDAQKISRLNAPSFNGLVVAWKA